MRNITEESVVYLFTELKTRNVPIVVLRNYQQLPDIGSDLDAALNRNDIGVVREIFSSDFFQTRWTEMCEVKTHNSPVDEQNIFIFKFFNNELNEYMQLDFFQGFLFKGQPFINIHNMLQNSRLVNGFPVVAVNVELKIKYFQILSAIAQNQTKRIEKYIKQANNLQNEWQVDDIDFSLLNGYLQHKEFHLFAKYLKTYRNKKLRQMFFKNPFSFIQNLFHRFGSFYSFFFSNPFVVKCQLSLNIDSVMLKNVMNLLVEKKCFRDYYIVSDESLKNRIKKYLYLAQGGGVIISFNKTGFDTKVKEELQNYIIHSFVQQHTSIN